MVKLCESGVVEFELGGILVPMCDIITYLRIDLVLWGSLGMECKKHTNKIMVAFSAALLFKLFGYELLFSTFFNE